MAVLVDTCGWIEWLADGPLAEKFHPFLEEADGLIVPTVIQYELYKWMARNRGEEMALKVIARTQQSRVIDLDSSTALLAADVSQEHGFSFADAVIYAGARKHGVELVTSGAHFEGLPNVTFFRKERGGGKG